MPVNTSIARTSRTSNQQQKCKLPSNTFICKLKYPVEHTIYPSKQSTLYAVTTRQYKPRKTRRVGFHAAINLHNPMKTTTFAWLYPKN